MLWLSKGRTHTYTILVESSETAIDQLLRVVLLEYIDYLFATSVYLAYVHANKVNGRYMYFPPNTKKDDNYDKMYLILI